MYILKGFVRIPKLANNDKDIVNVLGELSDIGRTYAKDKGIYVHSVLAAEHDVNVISFASYDDNGHKKANPNIVDPVTLISQWCYVQAEARATTSNTADFIRTLNIEFPGIVGTQAGKMVSDGRIWLPEWISFKVTGAVEQNEIKLWFSDPAFRSQYDEYEITIIPPIDTLDDFFKSANEVLALVNGRTQSELMDLIQDRTEQYPYTIIKSRRYDWLEPGNPSNTIATDWTILIYGQAGNSDDLIREAIVDHITDNTTHGREDWVEIFPDIFKSTEFMIIPFWHRFSIPDRILESGIYSPAITTKDALDVASQLMVGYPKPHITENLSFVGNTFSSLSIVTCGGPDNRDFIYKFQERFRDYIAVQTTSHDFNRMSTLTQGWVKLFNEMLLVAESMTEYSEVPTGMSRLNRDGVLLVSASYKRVQYMVVAKKTMSNLFG